MTYEDLFVDWNGRTPRGAFVGALIVLVAVAAFYQHFVAPSVSFWILLVLLFPAFVLHARRLHDMGRSAWLLLVPAALLAAALWLRAAPDQGPVQLAVTWAAAVAVCAFALWGVIGKGEVGANRFGAPAS